VPGAADHGWTLNDPRAAHRFSEHLALVAANGGTVAACGGGLTGIEAAAEIAESFPGAKVTLISSTEPGALMGDKARAYLTASAARTRSSSSPRPTTLRAGSTSPDAPRCCTRRA